MAHTPVSCMHHISLHVPGRTALVATVGVLLAFGAACSEDATQGALGDAGTHGDAPNSEQVWLDLEGVVNARDMGGWATASGKHVRHGVLFRSGDLSGLSAKGCDSLAALGVQSVIDLRMPEEAAQAPDAACAHNGYHNVGLAKLLPPSEENYLKLLRESGTAFREIFRLLALEHALPALIHCVIGRDRASVVTALILLSLDVSREDIVTEFLRSNEVGITVEAAWIEAVLDEVERAGGAAAYLAEVGVTGLELEALRTGALE